MVERVQDLRKLPPLPEKEVAKSHHPTLSDQVGKKGGSGDSPGASVNPPWWWLASQRKACSETSGARI